MSDFDLFVIGAGSGGVRASRMAANAGARVAVAEEKYLGGTCVNVGCVPKKLFYYGSHYHEDFSDARGYGWDVSEPALDWSVLRNNKDAEILRLNGIYASLLESAGVRVINGRATVTGPNSVEVGGTSFTAERILVAAGGKPFVPEFPGSDLVMTSDDVFYLDQLPQRVLVVGGGYIAVEFAGIFNGLGVDTSLVYRRDQLLRHFDHDLGKHVANEMRLKGIELLLNEDIQTISKTASALEVELNSGQAVECDAVLYATGRSPCTNGLGLGEQGVALRENGTIEVDEYFQSSVPSIFALGDIIGTPELTPVALAQAMCFVETWYQNQPRVLEYNNIATAVFCQPNVGTVGLSEEQAKQQGLDTRVYRSEFRHLKHTLSGNDERTFMKILVEEKSDKVLGVHMVGAEAGEIIQGMAIALNAGATKTVFDRTIGIHPTAAEEFVTMRTPVENG